MEYAFWLYFYATVAWIERYWPWVAAFIGYAVIFYNLGVRIERKRRR